MKWTSLTLAAALCACGISPAWGVDPGNTGPQSPAFPEQFNPSALPGQYNPAALPGQFNPIGGTNDPFFNPNPFNPSPTLPANPGFDPNIARTVPNPIPGQYPDQNTGRNRATTPFPQYGPTTPTTTTQRWRLGVYSRDSDTGVKIMEIVPGLAAARARLERNDTIIAVNGYQVGYVNGELYDCASEFERNADNDGWVTLLVQDSRTKNLMNVPVQLDSRMSRLQGSVALQDRGQIPAGAILQVDLQEIARPGSNPVTLATKQVTQLTSSPINFELDYDPQQVTPQASYVVHASLLANGRELYRTQQGYPALQNGTVRPVAIQLQRVSPQYNNPTGPINQEAQVAQIVRWFEDYLGRMPSDNELSVWLGYVKQGYPLSEVQTELISHSQFFNRCNRDKQVYVEKVHELLVGRKPNAQEMQYWLARYDAQNGVRRDLAREFQQAVGIQ